MQLGFAAEKIAKGFLGIWARKAPSFLIMGLTRYSRVIRSEESKRTDTFVLQNPTLEEQLVISRKAKNFLSNYKKGSIFNLLPSNRLFVSELRKMGFWNSSDEDVFICDEYDGLPLSSLNIELTNSCNLNCVHCYGSFGVPIESRTISLSQIEELLMDLDVLNTQQVTLTGGECLLVKDIDSIALAILERGLNLWVMTNGVLFDVLCKLVEKTKGFYYSVKISLDGLEHTHDLIRNKKTAFENTIKSLDFIYSQPNIRLYISTVVMKDNVGELKEIKRFVKERYPNAVHSIDIIFPSGNAKLDSSHCFSFSELKSIANEYPTLFSMKEKRINKKFFRCTGGISQATLKPDGKLKICNIAEDERFFFKKNVFIDGLRKVWEDCGLNISSFREEKAKCTKDCLQCPSRDECEITDCRVFAWLLTGSENNSSPMTCFMTRGIK